MREEIENAGNVLSALIFKFEELTDIALKKKEIILSDDTDSQRLINITTKEKNITGDLRKIEAALAESFKALGEIFGEENMNLSGLINRLIDNNEAHKEFRNKKEKIDELLKRFIDINNTNTSLLNTHADYYRYLFRKLDKSNTYGKENRRQKINLVSTTA